MTSIGNNAAALLKRKPATLRIGFVGNPSSLLKTVFILESHLVSKLLMQIKKCLIRRTSNDKNVSLP
jgi:hypothetical protein